MKNNLVLTLVLATAILCIAPIARAQETPESQPAPQATVTAEPTRPSGYIMLKAGIYSPSEKFDLETINGGQFERIDQKTGFDGELAFGYYFASFISAELSAGYFHSKGTPTGGNGETKLDVVPVLLTAKLLLPIGPIEPYVEGGGGAYITEFKGTGDLDNFKISTKVAYGLHAGAGVNLFITKEVFLGVEGRYIWSKPQFGGQDVKLNGFTVTGGIGFLL